MCARRRTSLTLMFLSSSGAERRSKPSSMLFIARRAFTRTCLVSCLTRLTFVSSENTIAAIFTRTNIMHAMATLSEPSESVRSPDASFADRPRMHSRGLGIDRLPHFLVAISGRACSEAHYLRSPLQDRGACQDDPYRRSDRTGEILSPSGTSQRRHHSPAHGGDIISAGKQDCIDSSMNSLQWGSSPGRRGESVICYCRT